MATQDNATNERLHLLGIRHHGPGSAALLRQALDALDPACVLIEGPPEGDALIPFVADAGMKPPVAMLLHATDDASSASFMPFAEFSPEWQAMHWALEHQRPVRFIDWPAAVSLAFAQQRVAEVVAEGSAVPETQLPPPPDALDILAAAAGYDDGEAFWNSLIEQHGGNHGEHALSVFASIEAAMAEARAHEDALTLHPDNEARDPQDFFVRVLWGGRPLRSSNPTLGTLDMIPLQTIMAYFDDLVGVIGEKIPAMCTSDP